MTKIIAIAILLLSFPASAKDIAWDGNVDEQEFECLVHNIYFEGAKEPFLGKLAIAMTTLNRVKTRLYPDTICEVVKQKTRMVGKTTGRVYYVCQFSWYCLTKNQNPRNSKWLEDSKRVAQFALDKYFLLNGDTYKDATHYHAIYIETPKWAYNLNKIARLGLHIFYRPHDDDTRYR